MKMNGIPTTDDDYINTREISRILECDRTHAAWLCRLGRLAEWSIRPGHEWFVPRSVVLQYKEDRERETAHLTSNEDPNVRRL